MRSLIILKGLVKYKKLNWVKEEKLLNFLINIENLKKIFYKPEYKGENKNYLIKSNDDTIYKLLIQSLCSRMSTGCLLVVDSDNEFDSLIEDLAFIFGYKVFYHYEDTPVDYMKNYDKYKDKQFLPLQKSEIKKQIKDFKLENLNKIIIDSYKDVENYWLTSKKPYQLSKESEVLYVSDLHSHYEVLKHNIPNLENFELSILLGDYIDGPIKEGSRKLIDFILESDYSNVIFIEGNHELRLRKYLGYLYFKLRSKKIASEVLINEIPIDFLNNTASEFSNLSLTDIYYMLKGLNDKLKEFTIYELDKVKYICTHAGIRWLEQLSPKFIGNVIYSSKNPNKIDFLFSKNYSKKFWSIHGHCKYPDGLEFLKYDRVLNLDTEDEFKVNYCISSINSMDIYSIDEQEQDNN